jgi:hypothetical protein
MFEQRGSTPNEAVGLIRAGIDALLGGDLAELSDREVLDLMTALETEGRRVPAVMHRVVIEADDRRLARGQGSRDTASLLRRRLRLSAGDARARVTAAFGLVGRSTVGPAGEQTGPSLPIAGAAQADGELSVAQARVIQQALAKLPPELRAQHAAAVESALVDAARRLDPSQLAARANRLLAELHPVGVAHQEAEYERLRGASFLLHPDGSADLRAHLTPVGAAIVQAALAPLAAPRPDDAGGRDERTPTHRLHDGLVEACRRLISAKEIPGEGGVPATVIVTVPLAELAAVAGSTLAGSTLAGSTRVGTATTQYGGTLTIHELLRVAGAALVVPVVVDEHQAPLHVGRAKRFATKEQTFALIARDKGCTFPGCDHPPPWTQRHHIRSWLDGGLTDIVNLTLLCVYHHANFEALGWRCALIDGVVHWVPPASVDPLRRPVRNAAHDRPSDAAQEQPIGASLVAA